jgi:hypothetical protein
MRINRQADVSPSDINNLLATTDKTVFLTVVGVVHDLKLANLVEGTVKLAHTSIPAINTRDADWPSPSGQPAIGSARRPCAR